MKKCYLKIFILSKNDMQFAELNSTELNSSLYHTKFEKAAVI